MIKKNILIGIGVFVLFVVVLFVYLNKLLPVDLNTKDALRLDCGDFTLVINDRVENTFETTFFYIDIYYKKTAKSEIIESLLVPNGHAFPLRFQDDVKIRLKKLKYFDPDDITSWNVYVSPKKFSQEEYEHISSCIEKNLDSINRAIKTTSYYEFYSVDFSTFGKSGINSLVYADYDSLLSKFACKDKDKELVVGPEWRVWLEETNLDGGTGTMSSYMGDIIDNGTKFVFTDYFIEDAVRRYTEYLQSCTDENGKGFFEQYQLISEKR